MVTSRTDGRLLAISDLHVRFPVNRCYVESLRPASPGDWILVAGDVGDLFSEVEWALRTLARHFSKVIWVPGNHELWTWEHDPVQLQGEKRYMHLVAMCQELGVVTPEDDFPTWYGKEGAATIVPLFLGYDGSFEPELHRGIRAQDTVEPSCLDDRLIWPDPYPTLTDWCHARTELTRRRLDTELPMRPPPVLVNHYPLVCPQASFFRTSGFARRCGTELTADWHRRYRARAVVYGHLHHPSSHGHDNVPFEEVSIGRPAEWRSRGPVPPAPRQVLPRPADPPRSAQRVNLLQSSPQRRG